MNAVKPKSPKGLGTRGRRFWRDVVDEFELSTAETQLLAEACRALDQIDELEAAVVEHGTMTTGSTGQLVVNPAVAQLNATRTLLGRLLAQLDLPDSDGKTIPTATRTRAQTAARSRWAGHDPSTSERNHRKTGNVVKLDGTPA